MSEDGPLIVGPLPCGCVYVHPWRTLCPAARAWEAKLRAAIKAGETEEARSIGLLLERHQRGDALPEVREMAPLTTGGGR